MNVAAKSSYFFYYRGAEVRILQRGNQKRGIYFRFQNAVRLCHLQFIFKVCDRAESADDRMRLAFLRKINSEPAERTDFDIWYVTVTINDDFVQSGTFDETVLKDGDVVEFLYFMGGGQ